MGFHGSEIITCRDKNTGEETVCTLELLWDSLSLKNQVINDSFEIETMNLKDMQIYDTLKGFVDLERIHRLVVPTWVTIELEELEPIHVEWNHPMWTLREDGIIPAMLLEKGDYLISSIRCGEEYKGAIIKITSVSIEEHYAYDLNTCTDRAEISGVYCCVGLK